MAPAGPVPRRARLGHGARGLQRRRRRLGLLPARPRPLARLPLERGRARRHLRRRAAALLRARVLERARPDPQGAHLRAHRPRATTARTPRSTGGTSTPRRRTRGCAGATSTRRREFPYERLVDENARARHARARVRAARHRRSSTTTATGTSPSTTPRRRPTTCCIRVSRPQRRARGGDARRAADAVVPQHVVVGPSTTAKPHARGRGRRARRRAPRARHGVLAGDGSPERAVLRQRDERRAAVGRRRTHAYPKDGINDHVVHGAATVNPERTGTKAALWYRLEVAPARPATMRLRLAPTAPAVGGDFDERRWPRASARPTSSTPS